MKTLIVIKKSLDHRGQTRVLPMPHLPHSPYFSYPHVMLMQAHTLLLKSYQHANGIDMMLPLADLWGARPARAPPFAWHPSSLADLGGHTQCTPPHLPGILVFDDILGHIV